MIGHSRVDAKNLKKLRCDLLHYSYRDWSDMIQRIDKFASRGAWGLYQEGKSTSAVSAGARGLGSFFKHFVLKRGFLDGMDGLTISVISAFSSYMKYALLAEKRRNAGRK